MQGTGYCTGAGQIISCIRSNHFLCPVESFLVSGRIISCVRSNHFVRSFLVPDKSFLEVSEEALHDWGRSFLQRFVHVSLLFPDHTHEIREAHPLDLQHTIQRNTQYSRTESARCENLWQLIFRVLEMLQRMMQPLAEERDPGGNG